MKMIALLGAAALAIGGIAATPAAAKEYHGDRGHHGYHDRGYRGHIGYRHRGYWGGYRGRWHGYHHRRVVCNRFGRCHRI
ncbi:hypothetical protein [Sphingomonas bacterium]|uniref:hypothetical protein n=1 Tax=Sphingomonas bacterium TaxID=1895847 RepID=UPI001576185D|nr:hypothetical protein [Sphingomonas bacterium]